MNSKINLKGREKIMKERALMENGKKIIKSGREKLTYGKEKKNDVGKN